ncbi:ABC transporter substrate-binding protein [Streptomyces sp. NPDC058595]|uniref:ABC transporter substrate-binding protein n=1 Tax=Streptomyces sp. NPDC058595 TaxID=3346550 RepID=UPI0036555967
MRRSAIIACSVALSAALASCSSPSPRGERDRAGAQEKPGFLTVADDSLTGRGTLTVQLDYDSVEADGVNPQTASSARSWMLGSLVYEPLVTIGPGFEIKPLLARSWEQPTPTTYVLTLREGATFSNGRPVTGEDAAGSLRRLLDSKGPYVGQLGPVKSVTATAADEVTVELSKPYTPFLAALANTPAAVLPMKEIKDGTLDLTKEMLGSGPFTVKEHRQDRGWVFEKNAKYHDADRVDVQELRIDIVPQEAARLAAVRNGTSGFAFFNNVDSVDQLSGTRNAKVVNQNNSDFYYLIQNSQNPKSPLADQKIRFALNSALDRQRIADVALGGQAKPTGVTPVVLPGACDPEDLPGARAAADAKAALKAAGADDLTLRLAVYTSEPALGQIAQVIQQQYAAAGVTVKIEKLDDSTYGERIFAPKADFDLAIGWFAGYVDASMVSRWWNPVVAGFSAGFIGDDKQLDKLIDTASAQPAGDAREKTLREVCDRVDTNAEMLPLVTRPGAIGLRTDKVSPTLYANEGFGNILRNITDFTLPAAK